jgi:hydrogenase maturation protein HypF
MGRLFDGVASLLGIRQRCAFEGQAAMELEAAAARASAADQAYPMPLRTETTSGDTLVLDWEPMLGSLLRDHSTGASLETVAARFHASLVETVVSVARHIGERAVVLSGGCFQNRLLLEGCVTRLTAEGHRVYWPQRVPPNDGSVALGQVTVAGWRRRGRKRLFRKTT